MKNILTITYLTLFLAVNISFGQLSSDFEPYNKIKQFLSSEGLFKSEDYFNNKAQSNSNWTIKNSLNFYIPENLGRSEFEIRHEENHHKLYRPKSEPTSLTLVKISGELHLYLKIPIVETSVEKYFFNRSSLGKDYEDLTYLYKKTFEALFDDLAQSSGVTSSYSYEWITLYDLYINLTENDKNNKGEALLIKFYNP